MFSILLHKAESILRNVLSLEHSEHHGFKQRLIKPCTCNKCSCGAIDY